MALIFIDYLKAPLLKNIYFYDLKYTKVHIKQKGKNEASETFSLCVVWNDDGHHRKGSAAYVMIINMRAYHSIRHLLKSV